MIDDRAAVAASGSDEAVGAVFGLLVLTTAWLTSGSGALPVVTWLISVALLFGVSYWQQNRFREANGVWLSGPVWASGRTPVRQGYRVKLLLIAGYVALLLAAVSAAEADLRLLVLLCAVASSAVVIVASKWWMRLYRAEHGADAA